VEIRNRENFLFLFEENFPFRSCPRKIFYKWKQAFTIENIPKILPQEIMHIRDSFNNTVAVWRKFRLLQTT